MNTINFAIVLFIMFFQSVFGLLKLCNNFYNNIFSVHRVLNTEFSFRHGCNENISCGMPCILRIRRRLILTEAPLWLSHVRIIARSRRRDRARSCGRIRVATMEASGCETIKRALTRAASSLHNGGVSDSDSKRCRRGHRPGHNPATFSVLAPSSSHLPPPRPL